jgi:HprK-related kinase B
VPAKRAAHPVSATLRLQFAEYRIDVETNSLRLAGRLQSYFSGYLALQATPAQVHLQAVVGVPDFDASKMRLWSRPSTPNRLPKESYHDTAGVRHILKNRTGVLISLSERGGASIVGALDEHANQVVNLIGTLFGLSLLAQGYVMVHASAIVHTGRGDALVFIGNSGSGKSSLALQLIERGGYDFLSNDRVLMRKEKGVVRVAGLPKKPRVNPGTLLASESLSRLVPRPRRRAYEQLPREELWRLEEKTDVDVERELGAGSRLTARLGKIYSLEWRSGGHGFAQRELDDPGALAAMQVTSKDFGPYDLHGSDYDPSPQFRRIARMVPFVALSGRADPKGFAARLDKDAR